MRGGRVAPRILRDQGITVRDGALLHLLYLESAIMSVSCQLSDELNVDLMGLGRAPLQVIRDAVKEIGYDDPAKGLDYNTMNVIVAIEEQSPDIAQSVDSR